MILLLTGPSGAGKTDTCWALVGRGGPMVFLDCDWFASCTPFSWQDAADVQSVYDALSLMLGFHVGRGARRFVVTLTFELASSFAAHRHRLERHGLPLVPFRLRCSEEALVERISGRDRIEAQKRAELAGAAGAQQAFDQLSSEFRLIDTTVRDSEAIADVILATAAA